MDAAVTGVVMGVLLPMVMAVGAFIMVVYIRKFENMERMAIIDKGLDPKLFRKDRRDSPSPVLRWALLLLGAGLGLLIGYFLDEAFYMHEVAYFSMLMVFGGLGLLSAYVIEERRAKKAKSQD